jgi:hypothetical protein
LQNPGAMVHRCIPWLTGLLGWLVACGDTPDPGPWCSLEPAASAETPASATYHRDVRPILERKCVGCHREEGSGPFSLEGYTQAAVWAPAIARAVREGHMPPWLAASCCRPYRYDLSMSPAEVATLERWAGEHMPEGNPGEAPTQEIVPLGGLSRVDVTLSMPQDYTPTPVGGGTDDYRCFLLDWPFDRPVHVTGLNPRPGNRELVHHLSIATVAPDKVGKFQAREGQDGKPGFSCAGGVSIQDVRFLGGGLLGSDYPDGIGTRIEPGTRILLNVHYSMARAPAAPDRTSLEFRVDEQAREVKVIPITNPAWLVGDAMRINAGDPDAVFHFSYAPVLITGNHRVYLRNVVPHLHAFASRVAVRLLRNGADHPDCLLEIPRWEFGWEQPFWFDQPIPMEPGDELYLECHFDNSAANQPEGQAPRDIAWGESDQDMCAAFVAFTEEP